MFWLPDNLLIAPVRWRLLVNGDLHVRRLGDGALLDGLMEMMCKRCLILRDTAA
jgi:hypothetical protein